MIGGILSAVGPRCRRRRPGIGGVAGAAEPRQPAARGPASPRCRPAAASGSARARPGCSKAPPWAPTPSSARNPPRRRPPSAPPCSAQAPASSPAAGSPPLKGAPLVEIAKARHSSRRRLRARGPHARAGRRRRAPARAVDDVSVLSADAQDNQQAAAGAVLSYTAEDGDLQGSAAAACQQPGNDLWLVGANTALGRSAVLNLTNASSTPATVSLDLFGAEGQIQAPGSRGLLVAPGSTRSIVLAGLAPGQERLGVRVRSTGGPVAAVIQQSVLRGLTPGGVDFITPGTAPSVQPGGMPVSTSRIPRHWPRSRQSPASPTPDRPSKIAVPGASRRRGRDQAVRPRRPEGAARRRRGHGEGRRGHRSFAGRGPGRAPTPWRRARMSPSRPLPGSRGD